MFTKFASLSATVVLVGCTLFTPVQAPGNNASRGASPESGEGTAVVPSTAPGQAPLASYESSPNNTGPGPIVPIQTETLVGVQFGSRASAAPQANGGATERELCARLLQHTDARARDIDAGVELVLAPKSDGDLVALRDVAGSVNMRLNRADSTQAAPADACPLFEMARGGGVVVTTINLPNGAKIVFKSNSAGRTQRLRQQAQALVESR